MGCSESTEEYHPPAQHPEPVYVPDYVPPPAAP